MRYIIDTLLELPLFGQVLLWPTHNPLLEETLHVRNEALPAATQQMNHLQKIKLTHLHPIDEFSNGLRAAKAKVFKKPVHALCADKLVHAVDILAVVVGVGEEEPAHALADPGAQISPLGLQNLLAEVAHQVSDH